MTTREDVLDAALTLLHDGGPQALSMRRLADALGVSYQVVYSRVGGKADVVRALHDDGLAGLRAATGALDDERGTDEHVHAVARGYLAHALHDPILFDVMFGAPLPAFVRDDAAREVERQAFETCWVGPVRDLLVARGDGRRATPLAYRLWAAVHGVVVVHLAGHGSPSGDPATEVDALVAALLA